MRASNGFTLLELMIVMAIIGVLSTVALTGFDAYQRKANFRAMLDDAARFSLDQQEHRQEFGRFASNADQRSAESPDNLPFKPRDGFITQVLLADFRQFQAIFTSTRLNSLPDNCQRLMVFNSQGFLRFQSQDAQGGDSTELCIPKGY